MNKECQYSHDNNKPSMFLDRETLYDNNFYEWKMIPKYLICKTFGSMSKFHPNLNFKKDLLKQFQAFYRSICNDWKTYFFNSPEIPSCILSEFLWLNPGRKASIFLKILTIFYYALIITVLESLE